MRNIGKLFNSLFGWNYMVAVIVGAIVIISYTSVGGFSAVATMDLIQSIIMTVALAIIVVFGVVQAGGMDAVLEHARSLPGFLRFDQTYNAATGAAEPYGVIRIVSMLAWGLGYFGMPHILVRFMAIRHEDELKLSRRIAASWVVISMAVAVFIGIVGHAVSNVGRIPALEGSATETVIVRLADLLSSYGILPAVVAGCILAGILAATMSTADSQLLAASSSVSDLRQKLQELQSEQEKVNQQLKDAQSNKADAEALKTQLEQQKALILSQISNLSEQIGSLDEEIVNKQDEIDRKQQEVDQKQAEYDQRWADFKDRMRAMQRLNDGGSIALPDAGEHHLCPQYQEISAGGAV